VHYPKHTFVALGNTQMTKVNGFQVNHRHTEEVDKINHSIHSHHMQECVCVCGLFLTRSRNIRSLLACARSLLSGNSETTVD